MKRTVLVSTCALVCLLISSAAVLGEGYSWTTWEVADDGNGVLVAVVFERGLWEDQRTLAKAEGGYLATIMSQEEQEFVLGVIQAAETASSGEHDYYWMGLFQKPEGAEPAGGWEWVTGEPLNYDASTSTWDGYTNWKGGEPNNGWGAGEDFGCIHRSSGVWNDGKACTGLRAVIEKEASRWRKEIFWTFGRIMVGAAFHFFNSAEVDGVISCTAFECGPDSLLGVLIEDEAKEHKEIPYMSLILDEHSGETGVVTRVEAFLDMIRRKKK